MRRACDGVLVAALSEDETIDEYEHRKLALREAIVEEGHVALVIFAAEAWEPLGRPAPRRSG